MHSDLRRCRYATIEHAVPLLSGDLSERELTSLTQGFLRSNFAKLAFKALFKIYAIQLPIIPRLVPARKSRFPRVRNENLNGREYETRVGDANYIVVARGN